MKKRVFLLAIIFLFSVSGQIVFAQSTLESDFRNPPHSARLQSFWWWQGSNFSKAGITKDLEAMKESGLGYALIGNLNSEVGNVPWPDQTYRGEKYWDALLHAAKEADRLGMTIGLNNAPGYCGTGGPWIKENMNMRRLVWRDTIVEGGRKMTIHFSKPQLSASAGKMNTKAISSIYEDIAVLAVPQTGAMVPVDKVLNLTKNLHPDGNVEWKAPEGKWKIYRIGYSPTMAESHPLPDDIQGKSLEADKFDPAVSRFHWKNVMDPLKQNLGRFYGKSFNVLHIDSYESGVQNWNHSFRDEFIKRKGYDPVPWLVSMGTPVLGFKPGQYNGDLMSGLKPAKERTIVGSEDLTKRFEWDFCDLVGRLFTENIKIGVDASHADGLKFSYQPYIGPFNVIEGSAMVDVPMATFWTHAGLINDTVWMGTQFDGSGSTSSVVSGGARAAGKKIVGSEAFTSLPFRSRFDEAPYMFKYLADGAFLCGVNQLMLHHWVHQPFDDKYQPGMCNKMWGTHFGRYQTWFEPGKAFFQYIIHTQAMLQFGEQVIDCLTIDGGYDHGSDFISSFDFVKDKTKVENGIIKLSSGRKYQYIKYSDGVILPEVAEKLLELAQRGATVVIPKQWTGSLSLRNYPQCDEKVKDIANQMFAAPLINNRVVRSTDEAKKRLSLLKDYSILKAQETDKIGVVHRSDGKTDIYFVVNRSKNPQNATLNFRITGKKPEIWNADDLSIKEANVWLQMPNSTQVSLNLGGQEALFLVFRHTAEEKAHITSVESASNASIWWNIGNNFYLSEAGSIDVAYSTGQKMKLSTDNPTKQGIAGTWKVDFKPKMGANFSCSFNELQDWSKNSDENIRYFSGTALYTNTVDVTAESLSSGKRTVLDLGEMYDIARIRINGGSFIPVWYKPFKTDITQYLKTGTNRIEIEVTNTWANALVGDERFPAGFEKRQTKDGFFVKNYPDWFLKNQEIPSGRKTFSTFNYYNNKSELHAAGLVGPVILTVYNPAQ